MHAGLLLLKPESLVLNIVLFRDHLCLTLKTLLQYSQVCAPRDVIGFALFEEIACMKETSALLRPGLSSMQRCLLSMRCIMVWLDHKP
jgi:hypothetical protein